MVTLDVTTDRVLPNGFTWSVLDCLLFSVVNGTAHVNTNVTENEKLIVCRDVIHEFHKNVNMHTNYF